MKRELEIGDYACLKEPFRGYRYVEIIEIYEYKILVRTSSGYEFTVCEDELEEE